jgi:predicted HNH restriction endonuclease
MEFQCSVCDYTSSFRFNVEKHINKQKKCGENSEVIEISVDIICEHCNKFYKTKKNLTQHLKVCRSIKEENSQLKVQLVEHKLKEENNKFKEENSKLKEEIRRLKELIPNNKTTIRTAARKKYKQHYPLICVHCRNSNEDNIQICHIKPIKEFDSTNIDQVNKLSNLISLCANCHLDHDKKADINVIRTVKLHSLIISRIEKIQ